MAMLESSREPRLRRPPNHETVPHRPGGLALRCGAVPDYLRDFMTTIPDDLIRSAQITASAYDCPVGIYVTVEVHNYTGGKMFAAIDPVKARHFAVQQPYVKLCDVLP